MADAELIAAIRSELRTAADPVRAAGAQAYMKSQMPSLGVRVPAVRRIVTAAAGPPAGDDGPAAPLEHGRRLLDPTGLDHSAARREVRHRPGPARGRYRGQSWRSGFFIRKAIGWALRDYSATDLDWVRAFVERHRAGLCPLSITEALRKLPP